MAVMNILVENQNFLVVFKPAGTLAVPSRLGPNDHRPCLLNILRSSFSEVLPVHRLDYEVQGLILFARNAQSHKILNQMFERHQVTKTYHALTPVPDFHFTREDFQDWQTWTSKIVRGKKRSFHAPHGKESVTRVRLVKSQELDVLEWQLQPLTGRTHQLRLELASRGMPILGDQRYGSSVSVKDDHIALIARQLDFSPKESDAKELLKEFTQIKIPDFYMSQWRQTFTDH